MRHLDLFSGIGGFALAASWVWGKDHEVVSFCEIDPFCRKVLEKHWPGVPIIEDVREIDGKAFKAIDLLTGGFPCQPFSCAGKQKGTEDPRHLWPQMLRVVSETHPTWIIGENVSGLLRINGGVVFESCCSSLEEEGYEVQPFIIPACAKDTPHRRDRIWIVANSASNGWFSRENTQRCGMEGEQSKDKEQPRDRWPGQIRGVSEQSNDCNTRSKPLYSTLFTENGREEEAEAKSGLRSKNRIITEMGTKFPSRFAEWSMLGKPYLVRDSDGLPDVLDRLRSLGNAIVPQVAAEIMMAIKQVDQSGEHR